MAYQRKSCGKKVAAYLFSHVGLAVMVAAYSVMGGFLFQALEAPHESKQKLLIIGLKNDSINEILQLADHLCYKSRDRANVTGELSRLLLQIQEQVTVAIKNNGWDGKDSTDESTLQWSFAGALLYAVTVITTIGYGHVAPKTTIGRIVTIFYALVGIPLTFLYLSNMGNAMAECFRLFYKKVCCFMCIYCGQPKQAQRKKLEVMTTVRLEMSSLENKAFDACSELDDEYRGSNRRDEPFKNNISKLHQARRQSSSADNSLIGLQPSRELSEHSSERTHERSDQTLPLEGCEPTPPTQLQGVEDRVMTSPQRVMTSAQRVRFKNSISGNEKAASPAILVDGVPFQNFGSKSYQNILVAESLDDKDPSKTKLIDSRSQPICSKCKRVLESDRRIWTPNCDADVVNNQVISNGGGNKNILRRYSLDSGMLYKQQASSISELSQKESLSVPIRRFVKSNNKLTTKLIPTGKPRRRQSKDVLNVANNSGDIKSQSADERVSRCYGGSNGRGGERGEDGDLRRPLNNCDITSSSDDERGSTTDVLHRNNRRKTLPNSAFQRESNRNVWRAVNTFRDPKKSSAFDFDWQTSNNLDRSRRKTLSTSRRLRSTLKANVENQLARRISTFDPEFLARKSSTYELRSRVGENDEDLDVVYTDTIETIDFAQESSNGEDTKVTVPISVCLIIIAAYIFGGSVLFTVWEDWDYITGSYFCFITLSTIGFGDIVPGTDMREWAAQQKLIICSMWLVVGLSLLAMCFNLMQEEVKAMCIKLGRKLGLLKDDEF